MELDSIRYPIGRAQRPEKMTPELRAEFIAAVEAVPGALRQAVAGLTEQQLDTPYREGGWTVRQVVHHLADAQVNAYVRFRLGMTEENPPIKPFDENTWAELPDAKTAPVEASLKLVEATHDRWARLMRSLPPEAFGRTVQHPVNGPMTLDAILAIYSWHGRHHTAHIAGLRERMGW